MKNENPFTPPSSNLEIEHSHKRSPLIQLPCFSTLLVVIFSIVTLGLYNLYWMYTRTQKLNALLSPEDRIANWLPTAAMTLAFISILLSISSEYIPVTEEFLVIDNTISIINFVFTLTWVFAIRKVINLLLESRPEDESWLNGFITFIFSIFYFQYRINQIHDSEHSLKA